MLSDLATLNILDIIVVVDFSSIQLASANLSVEELWPTRHIIAYCYPSCLPGLRWSWVRTRTRTSWWATSTGWASSTGWAWTTSTGRTSRSRLWRLCRKCGWITLFLFYYWLCKNRTQFPNIMQLLSKRVAIFHWIFSNFFISYLNVLDLVSSFSQV